MLNVFVNQVPPPAAAAPPPPPAAAPRRRTRFVPSSYGAPELNDCYPFCMYGTKHGDRVLHANVFATFASQTKVLVASPAAVPLVYCRHAPFPISVCSCASDSVNIFCIPNTPTNPQQASVTSNKQVVFYTKPPTPARGLILAAKILQGAMP